MTKKKSEQRGTFKYPSQGPNPVIDLLSDTFIKKITLQQNQSRGYIYEMMALTALHQQIAEQEGIALQIELDKRVFECVIDGKHCKRRIDLYIPQLKKAYEVKSYRVGMRKFIRTQIEKDAWLLSEGEVSEIWWFLFICQ